MNCSRSLVTLMSLIFLSLIACPTAARAHETGSQHLHFQKPGRGAPATQSNGSRQKFRRPAPQREVDSERVAITSVKEQATAGRLTREHATDEVPNQTRAATRNTKRPDSPDRRIDLASNDFVDDVQYEPDLAEQVPSGADDYPYCEGDSTYDLGEPYCEICEPGCGFAEPSCGCYEPGCGIVEPGCGCVEPSCGLYEPGCGIVDPGCGCAEPSCAVGVGCGSCVGSPGPDYWCFPICLPRFKDLAIWGGVHGFRGPRDFRPPGRSDSNFGFNEGLNISGRAPLVGLLFPQLSYQLGYQAVQSRLDGTVTTTDDRSQQFVTGGLFRRVHTGVQFGVVWDMMRDDLDADIDLHQIRSEISLKTPRGREIGFWSATSTNDSPVLGTFYATVDQYAGFVRWHYGNGYECRLWGGATGEGEGIFGGEFYAPLCDRWAVQSGFNYLNPTVDTAPAAVEQESWNIGINVVWHLGSTARRGCHSPFRPLFAVADNGWMFVDQAP